MKLVSVKTTCVFVRDLVEKTGLSFSVALAIVEGTESLSVEELRLIETGSLSRIPGVGVVNANTLKARLTD